MEVEIAILLVISCTASGLLSGWLLRSLHFPSGDAPKTESTQQASSFDREQLEKVANELRSTTMRVAADVDAHQSRMQQVTDQLSNDENASADGVFDAVAQLIQSNQDMQKQLGDAQNQIRQQALEIQTAEQRALTDGLTKLCNRRGFDDHNLKRFELRDNPNHPTTLMLVDVDHFKKFNDAYGHRVGDEVLKHVANHLEAELSDSGLVARYGGEEFAVVFDDLAVGDVQELADRVRAAIGQRDFIVDDQRLRITASAGLAQLKSDDSISDWIDRADVALYSAKNDGRDTTFWMNEDVAIRVAEPAKEIPVEEKKPETTETKPETPTADKSSKDISEVLSGLHDEEALREYGREKLSMLQDEKMACCALAIRIDNDQPTADQVSRVLSAIQSCVRSIESKKIGYVNESLFITLFPSADLSIVDEKAEMIRASVEQAGADSEAFATVRLASALAGKSEPFDVLLDRSIAGVKTGEPNSVMSDSKVHALSAT